MATEWAPLAWLAALSVPLLFLTRWLNLHLQGLGLLLSGNEQTAMLLHYLILLPGILLHEVSHLLAAKLVGVKTRSFSLRPKARRGGSVRFGAVTVTKSDPLRESWIGLAPLVTGTAGILLLARWQFGVEALPALSVDGVRQTLLNSLQAPDALLGLYTIFAISNSMWPSESDRQSWGGVALFLVLAAGLVLVSGLAPMGPSGPGQWIRTAVKYLAFAFALSVAVDAPFAAAVLVLEKAGERMLGQHVDY